MRCGKIADQNTMLHNDEYFLRLTIALAKQSRERGNDPYAAMLVKDGEIVHQVMDRCVEMSDPTYHAELSLISEYCRANRLFSLEGYTLYASTEPCPMCAGAIHWARISRLVFSVSQAMLQEMSGGSPKLSAASLIKRCEIVGPLLSEEGLAVFAGWPFVPKVVRHAQRKGGAAPNP